MERERLLIARFIREHPQFRYQIKYDEHLNMYMLYYETDVARRCMGIASGVSYDVLLKKFNNGIVHRRCEICFECDSCSCNYMPHVWFSDVQRMLCFIDKKRYTY